MSDRKNVIDLSKKRQEVQEESRREYERFVFKNFLSCYVVTKSKSLHEVEAADISKAGMRFVSNGQHKLLVGDAVNLRVYFTHEYFIEVHMEVARVEEKKLFGFEELHYGCKFDIGSKNHETLQKLVELVESFSKNAQKDPKRVSQAM
jgi:hypothetical protein